MSNYKTKLAKIKALAFDVDGVMTNGDVISTSDGELHRTFSSRDGFGIRMCKLKNYPIGIITGGDSASIMQRFLSLGVEERNIFQKARNKYPYLLEFCKNVGVEPEEVAYIGDDIPDIEVLQKCGLSVCPSDAAYEVKEVCDYISIYPGGKGCVRELIEQVMKIQNNWDFDPLEFEKVWS